MSMSCYFFRNCPSHSHAKIFFSEVSLPYQQPKPRPENKKRFRIFFLVFLAAKSS